MTRSEAELLYKLALTRLEGGHEDTQEEDLASMRRAAEAGYAPAQFAYAKALALLRGDCLGGLPLLIAAAQQGHTESRVRLAGLYARKETVRARVGELLTSEQVAALGLRKGSLLTRLLSHEEGENSAFGLLVGILFMGGMACFVLSRLLPALASWLDGTTPTEDEVKLLSLLTGVLFFCLCFVAACIADGQKRGSAGEHPFVLGCFCLFFGFVAAALFCWGGHSLCHAEQDAPRWWLAGALCCLGGLLALLFLLKLLFHLCAQAARGGHRHSFR